MLQRRARMFYSWIKHAAEIRERECEERINELRKIVFKQSERVESGIVAIVRERLVDRYRKASVTEEGGHKEEEWEGGGGHRDRDDIATAVAGLRDRILAWKDTQQDSQDEDSKTNDSVVDEAIPAPEIPLVNTQRSPPLKLFPHPYYDGVPTPSRPDDGSLLSLPQYHEKFTRR